MAPNLRVQDEENLPIKETRNPKQILIQTKTPVLEIDLFL